MTKRKVHGLEEEEHDAFSSNKHQPILRSSAPVEIDVNLTLSLAPSPALHCPPPPSVPPPVPPYEEIPPQVLLHQSPLTQPLLELPPSHPIFNQSPSPTLAQVPSNPNPVPQRPSASSRAPRARKNPTEATARGGLRGKSEIIPAPFPWAADRRATTLPMEELFAKGIHTVYGNVQCKKCERIYEMEYDIREKFEEVKNYISVMKDVIHQRAQVEWSSPTLPTCKFCGQENSCKPVISEKKRSINWLFLYLGQLLGCCTLEQLKYFCKHTKNHRTGAKDRVLYLAYFAISRQLDPNGPFDP